MISFVDWLNTGYSNRQVTSITSNSTAEQYPDNPWVPLWWEEWLPDITCPESGCHVPCGIGQARVVCWGRSKKLYTPVHCHTHVEVLKEKQLGFGCMFASEHSECFRMYREHILSWPVLSTSGCDHLLFALSQSWHEDFEIYLELSSFCSSKSLSASACVGENSLLCFNDSCDVSKQISVF